MHEYGLPDETCNPYKAQASDVCDERAECQNCMMFDGDNLGHCWAVKNYTKYYVKEYGYVSGEAAMMSELHARGPLTCGMAATQDFCFAYQSGIWTQTPNVTDDEVDHDVEVIGWGEENGVKYWKIRNSWGTYWGENGFFRLLRGQNALRIEDRCSSAIVDVHELDERLHAKRVGSMYGPLKPGVPVGLYPANWNEEPHDWTGSPIVVEDPEHSSILPGGKIFNTRKSEVQPQNLIEAAQSVSVAAHSMSIRSVVLVAVAVIGTALIACAMHSKRQQEYLPLK